MDEGVTRQRVWDVAIRVFHWSLAACVLALWWTAENGHMDWHRRLGFLACGLLVFRIYWGFAGPETARFARFLTGPRTVLSYVGSMFRRPYKASFGHNPLGALSVLALLSVLLVQLGLGLFAEDVDGLASGPLARFLDYDTARAAAELHETFFWVVMAFVALHLAAIVFYMLMLRTNLIGAMVSGSREVETNAASAAEPVRTSPLRVVIGIALAAGTVVSLNLMG